MYDWICLFNRSVFIVILSFAIPWCAAIRGRSRTNRLIKLFPGMPYLFNVPSGFEYIRACPEKPVETLLRQITSKSWPFCAKALRRAGGMGSGEKNGCGRSRPGAVNRMSCKVTDSQIKVPYATACVSAVCQLCERFSPSSAGYSSNRNYAQNGTYFMYFRPVSGLRGRISLASRVSLMTREATALLFSEIPKRPRKVLFVIGSCCTYFRQACR